VDMKKYYFSLKDRIIVAHLPNCWIVSHILYLSAKKWYFSQF
jgi:hypothetical protein